jgi:NAD(P)H-dependent FMN reductase
MLQYGTVNAESQKTIVGLSGSLRAGSFNSGLLRAAAVMFPGQVRIASIRGIPLYDADIEAREGVPEAVKALKDEIAASAGLLLVTPEYNKGIPGVMKNAIDGLSRPPDDIKRVFHERPVAVIGASPGGFGTILAQAAWLPVLRTLRTRPYFGGRLMVSSARNLFDEAGELHDEDTREKLRQFVEGFIDFSVG